jgi:hypothetical protein
LRKLTYISYQYNAPDVSWKRLELPGLPNFTTRWKSWLVYKCTWLLIGAVKPEHNELYGECIRTLIAS